MALRQNWKFSYKVEDVLAAATTKRKHHVDRLRFWQDKQDEVMVRCKQEGLVVHESLAGTNYTNKSPGYGPRIEIPIQLQQELNESTGKITEHTSKVADYDAWVEVLTSQKSSSKIELDQQDYLFFFGK